MADRHEGRIKSFSEKTEYGFITCDEVHAQYGGDVFLSRRELGNCRVGDMVTFSLQINKQGKPQAVDVRSLNENALDAGQAAAVSVDSMRLPGVIKSINSASG
jgi:cold shock CspA family protein